MLKQVFVFIGETSNPKRAHFEDLVAVLNHLPSVAELSAMAQKLVATELKVHFADILVVEPDQPPQQLYYEFGESSEAEDLRRQHFLEIRLKRERDIGDATPWFGIRQMVRVPFGERFDYVPADQRPIRRSI